MSTYSYQPLANGHIRLLRLFPHEDEHADIRCQLFQYPLSGSRKGTHRYEALSYCWGHPKKVSKVLTDVGWIQVTRNLHTALSRLRDPLLERVIWTDAICINQKDLEERSQQVQLMAEIYARASCVIVWLEDVTNDYYLDSKARAISDQALQSIRRAAEQPHKQSSNNKEEEKAVTKLLTRSWFRRIWVHYTTTGSSIKP